MCDCFVETEDLSRDLFLFPFLSKVGFLMHKSPHHTQFHYIYLLRVSNLRRETENWRAWKKVFLEEVSPK